MKIIFLDFDGVVTTYDSQWRIDNEKTKLINKICQKTSAKIVVSSSWKVGYYNVEDFKEFLNTKCDDLEFINNIIGLTRTDGGCRGEQIANYLKRNNDIDTYVIIDDDSDMLEEQLFNFVQTDTYEGITEREVKLCVQVLNGIEVINPIRLNLELITKWRNRCTGVGDRGIEKLLMDYRKQF